MSTGQRDGLLKTTPLTPVLAAEGGHFGLVNGWERLEYIKPTP
jgi:dimethylglycine dehydrogenase